MRRAVLLTVIASCLVAGCGGSSAPFFVVRNDQAAPVIATYCTTLNCQHDEQRTIPAGSAERFINVTGEQSSGVLRVSMAGRPSGCTSVPPAILMVDRLYAFSVSTLLTSGCAGYNPVRAVGLPKPASRR